MSFHADLQTQLDRLSAKGWTREQIAAATGYTRQRLSAWARGPVEPPHALRVGLLSVLRRIDGPPPTNADAWDLQMRGDIARLGDADFVRRLSRAKPNIADDARPGGSAEGCSL